MSQATSSELWTTPPPLTPPLRALRAGFQGLSWAVPGLAAKAAGRLFLTPRRHARRAAEVEVLERAEPFQVPFRGQQLAAWRWGSGPAVLCVHGWEGRGSQFAAFVQPLVELGYSVVAFDALGHGESPGRQSSAVELRDCLLAVVEQVQEEGELRAALGHSLGCAALARAMHEGLGLTQAVFIAGPARLSDYFTAFGDLLGLTDQVQRRMIAGLEARYGLSPTDLDVERLPKPPGLDLLLVHDEDDREAGPQNAHRIAEVWPGSELLITSGLGHRRILRAPQVVQAVTAFLGAP